MIVSEIKLYELHKAKIGEKEADAFVEILEAKVEKKFEEKKDIFSTKQDLAMLQNHIEGKINDLLKWMIVMWITQLGAIVTIIKLMIN